MIQYGYETVQYGSVGNIAYKLVHHYYIYVIKNSKAIMQIALYHIQGRKGMYT